MVMMAVLEATRQCPHPHVLTSHVPKRQTASVVKALRKSAPTWRKAENIFTCFPLPGIMDAALMSPTKWFTQDHTCGLKALMFERHLVAYMLI